VLLAPVAAGAGTLPSFEESVVLGGLVQPTAVRFASDGRVFVAEKSGIIKVLDGIDDSSPTTFADLSTNVHNYWDRGLLGMALHPNFPASPYVYVLYTYDAAIGGLAPRWGTPGILSDGCPTPPGPTSDGCVVSGRLSRLQAAGNVATGNERVLIEDWCQQYPSHSVGGLAFGPDGALYVSGGDGASWLFSDYGQDGNPINPCGDPPVGVGGLQSAPSAQGGSLRSQDLRTSGDPVSLDGTVIRVDPDTGQGLPDNPLATSSDPNARRIVAYGLRNPFRLTTLPGTSQIWLGDVGRNTWEEINRIRNPSDSVVENFGWPCYEGSPRQSSFDVLDLTVCENLYAQSGAVTPPFREYSHSAKVVPGETCPTGSSSISGIAFSNGGSYPAGYDGALFFADYSRDCIWAMRKGADGVPDPSSIVTFVSGASNPVDLQFSSAGELYYADFDGGTVRRVRYTGSPSRPGLVAALAFDETSGSTAADSSGNGNTGTIAGSSPSTSGRFSGALSFDGVDDTVTIADANSLDLSAGMTIAAWLRPTAIGGRRTAVLKEGASSPVYSLYANGAGNSPFAEVVTPGTAFDLGGTVQLPLSTWTHLAVTYDGSTMRMFVNGDLVSSRAATGAIVTSADPLRIGGNPARGEYFQGRIDDVRVYNRALAASEIQADLNTPAGGQGAPDTAPPAVLVTAPVSAATIGGSVSVSADASDDVGIAGVRFRLDGVDLAPEDMTAPYSVSWNTTTAANGSHTLTAVARDAAGNLATSASVSVTVSNSVPDGVPPTAPAGLTASVDGAGVALSWGAATDEVGVVRYAVHRSTTPGFTPSPANWIAQPSGLTLSDSGLANGTYHYRVTAEDAAGNVGPASNEAAATVAVNTPPTAVISAPSSTLGWAVGDAIAFSGSAGDAQDGTLPASRLSWDLILHHCPSNCHTHSLQTFAGLSTASFNAPDHEYPSHLELRLTATDSHGAADTESVLIHPQTVALTLASTPTGLQLVLGEFTGTAPFSRTVIVGSTNSVTAPSPQLLASTQYSFTSWSDGLGQSHNIVAPSTPATFTAAMARNDTPTSTPQALSTAETTPRTFTLAGGDAEGAPLAFTLASVPAGGALYAGAAPSGTPLAAGAVLPGPQLTYVPATGFTGPDAFSFTTGDGSLESAPATVAVTVRACTLRGGELADVLTGGDGSDVICAGGGNDTISGGGGDDILVGESGSDRIAGGGGQDQVAGGEGSDIIAPGPGDDNLPGGIDAGPGSDVLSYAAAAAGVTVDLGAGTSTGGEGNDSFTGFENVEGSAFGDTLTGDAARNNLFGLEGNDTLNGGGLGDGLDPGPGTDTVNGGPGFDNASYFFRVASVTLSLDGVANDGEEGEGDNVGPLGDVEALQGGAGADVLTGDDAGNNLFGQGGNDILNGGAGDDGFDPGLGADTLNGGAGFDTASYFFRAEGVTLSLNDAADDGEPGEGDNIGPAGDVEGLQGGRGADILSGNAAGNSFSGQAGDDRITSRDSSPGADTVRCGEGADTVTADGLDLFPETSGQGGAPPCEAILTS